MSYDRWPRTGDPVVGIRLRSFVAFAIKTKQEMQLINVWGRRRYNFDMGPLEASDRPSFPEQPFCISSIASSAAKSRTPDIACS